jgi:hypothetical protein
MVLHHFSGHRGRIISSHFVYEIMETHAECSDRLLAGLDEYLVIEHAEANLFRPDSDIAEEAGLWYEFFVNLNAKKRASGLAFGIKWNMTYNLVKPMKGALRYARWLEVILGDEKLVVAFLPHIYHSDSGKPYLDHRFVVAGNGSKAMMATLIFKDAVLGKIEVENDPPWLHALQS